MKIRILITQFILVMATAMTFTSCDWSAGLTLEEWLDAIGQPTPVVVDTCTQAELHQVHTPLFVSGYVAFDCAPDSLRWHVGPYSGNTELLGAMLGELNPGLDSVAVFVNGQEAAIIMYGTDDKSWVEGRVSCNPSCNPIDHLPAFGRMSLYLGGALTYADWIWVLDGLPSNSAMNMRAPNLTQEEKNLIWEANLEYDSCKIAPTGTPLPNRIDFRHDNAPQSIRDRYKERLWNTVE